MGSSAYTTEAPKTVTPETVTIGVQVDGMTIGTINVALNAPEDVATAAARAAYPTIPEGATTEYKAGKIINFSTPATPAAPSTEPASA